MPAASVGTRFFRAWHGPGASNTALCPQGLQLHFLKCLLPRVRSAGLEKTISSFRLQGHPGPFVVRARGTRGESNYHFFFLSSFSQPMVSCGLEVSRFGKPWDPASLRSSFTRSEALLSRGPAQLCHSDKIEERCHAHCSWPWPFPFQADPVLAEVGRRVFSAPALRHLEKGCANSIFTSFPLPGFFWVEAGSMGGLNWLFFQSLAICLASGREFRGPLFFVHVPPSFSLVHKP